MEMLHLLMSRCMGKPTICIGENKGADQLRSNCEADQHLCFRYTDSTIPLLSKSKTSSLYPSVTVQLGLCWTSSEPKLLVFSRTGSNGIAPLSGMIPLSLFLSSISNRYSTLKFIMYNKDHFIGYSTPCKPGNVG